MAKASRNLQFSILFVLYYLCTFIAISSARNISLSKLPQKHRSRRNLNIRGVNLGGWLVAEGWITPSLIKGIPDNDLLDGCELTFFSASVGKYLSAESGGGTIIVANRTFASDWESFSLWRVRDKVFYLRMFTPFLPNKQFLGVNSDGVLVATENAPSVSQQFLIERNPKDPTRVRILASNGRYIQVKNEELVTADSMGGVGWGDDDPSIFKINRTFVMEGEFQVTNGYGPVKATQVMREHWDTFIVEKDFEFMSRNGINAVRIPVGWWIAHDPSPPQPFVGGSLQYLDKAFLWARKYGMKVIIDLHAAPGAQNLWAHSATRDGTQAWGETDESIQQTVAVIEFLTARYAKHPSLLAVELLNEPFDPFVPLETLKKYYKAAYNVIRKHSKTVYVMMNSRLNQYGRSNDTELLSFATGLKRVVLDVHYYNNAYKGNNIDHYFKLLKKFRRDQLRELNTPNGPLIFVGEWVSSWDKPKDATDADYKRFCELQLEIYGKATFGWAFFTYKSPDASWSLQDEIKNGNIKIK